MCQSICHNNTLICFDKIGKQIYAYMYFITLYNTIATEKVIKKLVILLLRVDGHCLKNIAYFQIA